MTKEGSWEHISDLLGERIIGVIEGERARSVLEISGYDDRLARLIKDAQKQNTDKKTTDNNYQLSIDRVDLTGGGMAEHGAYNRIYGSEALGDTAALEAYDVIIVLHLFENMIAQDAKELLETLLLKTVKQVLVITPEYSYDLDSDDENKKADVRAYHPVFFLGMDFSYDMPAISGELIQIYSFFPKISYAAMQCDRLPEFQETAGETGNSNRKKLKIGFIFSHHRATGAMIAICRYIRELAKRGHIISVYFRRNDAQSALPEFSMLSGREVPVQVVIPESGKYIDYIDDEDIIILSWMQMIIEFADIDKPVHIALWEQGTPALYGDYGKFISSDAWQRRHMHEVYRAPVHMLAVSYTVQKVLKGIYNRTAQYFPNGIDTEFFYPLNEKNNEIPVVLLIGNPFVEFKGFRHAFKVLNTAREMGLTFKVHIAAQLDFKLSPEPEFQYEKFINPSQTELAALYRGSDILLSASLYESFPLPPMEAMASGTAVIAMDCGGINTYAEPGVNCLLCEQGDTISMYYALEHLLKNPAAREELAAAGLETAKKYSFENMAPAVEQCLYNIVRS